MLYFLNIFFKKKVEEPIWITLLSELCNSLSFFFKFQIAIYKSGVLQESRKIEEYIPMKITSR